MRRHEQFRTLLLGLAASRRIALFTLGPYAAGRGAADLDGFVDVHEIQYRRLRKCLGSLQGQTLKVIARRIAPPMIHLCRPSSSVQAPRTRRRSSLPSGAPRREQRATITDLQVEGVSLATAQRADFTAFLQQHNGSIPELAKISSRCRTDSRGRAKRSQREIDSLYRTRNCFV